ncbi:DL-endopeptidase inhibitor IseA family protein [Brevibacillus sp. H7]|uniref:DL-endopeptidase inhibitor IseA family protein n=1 Tax=Brevibacillus sp. H7 TaxID=3349138 RepID=UPI00380B4494
MMKLILLAGSIFLLPAFSVSQPPAPTLDLSTETKMDREDVYFLSEMNEKTLPILTGEAQKRYWHVMAGRSTPDDPTPFKPAGSEYDYQWLGSDVDTKEEFLAYFEAVYTKERAEDFLKKQMENKTILEINGKLAKIVGDSGSILEWDKIKPTLVSETPTEKVYSCKVSNGEEEFASIREIKVRLVEGAGWKLDSEVQSVK